MKIQVKILQLRKLPILLLVKPLFLDVSSFDYTNILQAYRWRFINPVYFDATLIFLKL